MSSAHTLRPFYFSPLTAAVVGRENIKTLDLISKLYAPLPLPKQPTSATSGEKMIEDMPEWVAKLIVDKRATFTSKVMEKEIYASDASDQQNGFLIRKQIIHDRTMPAMTEEELASANLISTAAWKRRKLCGREGEGEGEGEAGERKQGREHGGLEVMVDNRNVWGCSLYLTRCRWDASRASVLKGGKYREFHRRSHFAIGGLVEMWAFRDGDGKLCFAIGNKVDLKISL